MNSGRTLHLARQVLDGAGLNARPGAVLMEGDHVLAAGRPQEIGEGSEVARIDHGASVLVPALVNAHTHLDLTHIGPKPYAGSFSDWVQFVRTARADTDDSIRSSVLRGIEFSRAGGVAMIGDIAGVRTVVPGQTMAKQGMCGVSFVEVFGIGRARDDGIRFIKEFHANVPLSMGAVRFGLQPHAPYSCDAVLYRAAAQTGRPLATHVAETLEELRFTQKGDGPLAEFLEAIGVWDDSIRAYGTHPVQVVLDAIEHTPILAAHLNYVDGVNFDSRLMQAMSVVYCPRASTYFGHPLQGHQAHQYRAMLDAGVTVALGTDSMVCLYTPHRMSTLDEMRFLYQRDHTDPVALLRMATVHGAHALGGSPDLFTFRPGPCAGVLAIACGESEYDSPIANALSRDEPPRWVSRGGLSGAIQ